eukprot:3020596-Rhodomonas_salina.1
MGHRQHLQDDQCVTLSEIAVADAAPLHLSAHPARSRTGHGKMPLLSQCRSTAPAGAPLPSHKEARTAAYTDTPTSFAESAPPRRRLRGPAAARLPACAAGPAPRATRRRGGARAWRRSQCRGAAAAGPRSHSPPVPRAPHRPLPPSRLERREQRPGGGRARSRG